MKISLVWNWDMAEYYFDLWNDGLKAALEVIARDHEIEWCLGDTTMPAEDTDFVLVWSDTHSLSLNRLWSIKKPLGLLLTASPVNYTNLEKFKVVFAESPYIVRELTEFHPTKTKVIHAFGTNTKLFRPMEARKYYHDFYPATFSPWKRQDIFASLAQSKGLALGTIQPDGEGEYRACELQGVRTIIGYMPAEQIAMFYNQSDRCLITAWHGSERTVLEALACGIPVMLYHDNQKAVSLIPKELTNKLSSGFVYIDAINRKYVLENYSEEVYAKRILEGITGSI